MYAIVDQGHVYIPGTLHDVSDILFRGNDRIGIDAHAFPIVYTFHIKGYRTTHSCGGHLNTREWTDPVEVGLDIPYTEAEELVKELTVRLERVYPDSMLALEKIVTVPAEYDGGPILLFYHTTEELRSDCDLKTHPAFRESNGRSVEPYREYDLHIVPELILEWNKTIMVSQVAAMILEL